MLRTHITDESEAAGLLCAVWLLLGCECRLCLLRGREGERGEGEGRGREGEREKKIKGFASGHTAMICCCSHAGGAKLGVSLHVASSLMFAVAGSIRLGGGGDVVPRTGAVHRHTCIRGVRICERTA